MIKLPLILVFIIFFVIFSKSTFAASMTLSNGNPAVISETDREYQVDINLSINTSDGTIYYLRGAFYQPGTNNYCGYTWNGSSWYNGPYTTNEGWKNLLAITVSSDSAAVTLKGKLDVNDSGCKKSGNYNFKVQRFTQSGSGTFDTQNEQTITVAVPTLPPSPTPNPTITPTSKPSPSAKPTSTPK
ncbi:hypothetical protein FJY90_02795, partial [Candidatus Gottesmanbacteria bacterium]|nr:hypothetical protein [Candidatus Gottesmanbacteria bacterium]